MPDDSKSALSDWVKHEEDAISKPSWADKGVPFHKVTVRLSFDAFVRLKLLSSRYPHSTTAIAERALEAALEDATELAGITEEEYVKRAELEYAALEEKHKVTPLSHTIPVEA